MVVMSPEQYTGTPEKPLHIALKNNLLYDAALLPNLTAEIYLGKQWSLAIEGNLSWWASGEADKNGWYHRIQTIGAEGRYWVQSPYPLLGHAVGLYAMTGNYDIRFSAQHEDEKGWLSRHSWSTGFTYAYSMPIAERFNLEFGFALGYVGGQYYQYNICTKHKQWTQQAIFNRKYFGPTRLEISLVWLPGTGNSAKNVEIHQKGQIRKAYKMLIQY
jgi:hypothetical protein